MKNAIKLLYLLTCLTLLVFLAAGCQAPDVDVSKDTTGETTVNMGGDVTVPENRCTAPVVMDYERWLNGKLADLGYPLTVTFLAPAQEPFCDSVITYSGSGEDIYTDYLYFYLPFEDGGNEISYTCASVREGASEEVFAAHKEISRIMPTYYDADITAEQVDQVFAQEPGADVGADAYSSLPYVDTYESDGTFRATYRDKSKRGEYVITPFEFRVELATGHVWFFALKDQEPSVPPRENLDDLEPCTLPFILELQEVINRTCAEQGYPLECDFVDKGNIRARFRYTGEGEDVYTSCFYMYADLDGADTAIHYFCFELDTNYRYSEESCKVFRGLCAAVNTYFHPFIAQESVERLFTIKSGQDVQTINDPYIYTKQPENAGDWFERGCGEKDSAPFCHLLSMPGLDGYRFACFPQCKRKSPNLTVDAFWQRLEEILDAPIHEAVNDITKGYMQTLFIDLDSSNAVYVDMHYGERSRILNKLLIRIGNGDNLPETQRKLAKTVAGIVSVIDPELDSEIFTAFCLPFCEGNWKGEETTFCDFSYNNISCRFYADYTTFCQISFLAKDNDMYGYGTPEDFSTLSTMREAQELINDACQTLGYPIECVGFTAEDGHTNHMAHFRYLGEGVDVYDLEAFRLYLYHAYGYDTPESFEFLVDSVGTPQGMEFYRDICKAAAAYYLPNADMEKVELLFAIEPKFETGYTCQVDPEVSAYMYEASDCFIREYYVGAHRVSYVTYPSGFSNFTVRIPHTEPLTARDFFYAFPGETLPENYTYGYSYDGSMDFSKQDGNTPAGGSCAVIKLSPVGGTLESIDIHSDVEPELMPTLFAAAVSVWDQNADTEEMRVLCETAMQTISDQKTVFYNDGSVECYVVLVENVPHCVTEFLVEPVRVI